MGITKLFTILMASIALITGCTATTFVQRERQLYVNNPSNVDHLMNSVVAMVEQTEEGQIRTFCTAFYIAPRRLATAAHCVAERELVELAPGFTIAVPASPRIGAEYRFVTYQQYQEIQRTEGEPRVETMHVVAFDVDADVALLDLAPASRTSEHYLAVNSTVLAVGEHTYAVGMPGGIGWILTDGIVSQLVRKPSGALERIHASTQIFFGNSGGPLCNENGEVVAVASAIAYRQPHLGIFAPASHLRRLLNGLVPMPQRN